MSKQILKVMGAHQAARALPSSPCHMGAVEGRKHVGMAVAQPVGGNGCGPSGCDTGGGVGEAMLQPKSVAVAAKPAAGCDTGGGG